MIVKVLMLLTVAFLVILFGGGSIGNAIDHFKKGDYMATAMNIAMAFIIMTFWFVYLATWFVKFLII